MELILDSMAIVSFVPGFVWLLITIHVLHFSELKHGKFIGWIQFWPFYQEMKDNYPESSRWARYSTYLGLLLLLPWLVEKIIEQ